MPSFLFFFPPVPFGSKDTPFRVTEIQTTGGERLLSWLGQLWQERNFMGTSYYLPPSSICWLLI